MLLIVAAALLFQVNGNSVFLNAAAAASKDNKCFNCHGGIYESAMQKVYIHAPFQEQKCSLCHLLDQERQLSSPGHEARNNSRKKVKWLGENPVPANHHWFLVPASALGGSFLIENRQGGRIQQISTPIPALESLPVQENDVRPPEISEVQVLEIEKGLFLSVTIGWQTDEVADSTVQYGTKNLQARSPRMNRFTRKHQVTLLGLRSNRTYRFSVTSRDPFGNEATSATYTFSTAQAIAAPESFSRNPAREPEPLKAETRFFRIADACLIEIVMNEPAAISIGVQATTERETRGRSSEENRGAANLHSGMQSRIMTSLYSCSPCHGDYTKTLSHPVGVYPKRGMVIPPEYPTLPDGRITCMSCHSFHASNHEFRLIKSSKQELCTGCHLEFAQLQAAAREDH